jgi:UDP-GlcNAc:undecaprenyl-phosphate GlcNAc-1-phosphate transferase
VREYLITMLVAAGTTYLLVGPASALARRVGAVPATRDRDVHRAPVPRLGGLAMLGGLLAAMLVASFLPKMSLVFDGSSDARALLTAAAAICLVGAADDLWDLSALTKLAGQLLAAGLLVAQGVQLIWLPLPTGGTFSLDPAQGALLTVLLVVATANAVNFIDGLDGLAAGVVGIGAAAVFTYVYALTVAGDLVRLTMPALVTAIIVGVCLGFLPHNVHPARVFMGDSGALLLGLLLASGTITLTGRFPAQGELESTFLLAVLPLLIPVAVIALPATDMLLAVFRRTGAGRSPFTPDKHHLHHRLLDLGHSHRRAVLIMWAWAALIGFGVVLAGRYSGWMTWLVLVASLAVVLVVTRPPRSGSAKHRHRDQVSRPSRNGGVPHLIVEQPDLIAGERS